MPRNSNGSYGNFDAAEPWGAWTTIAYYQNWIDAASKFIFNRPTKWMSDGGLVFYMAFSGNKTLYRCVNYDSFNVIRGTFVPRLSANAKTMRRVGAPLAML